MTDVQASPGPTPRQIAEIVALTETEAVARLQQAGWWTPSVGQLLAEWVLGNVEVSPLHAANGLTLGRLIERANGSPTSLAGWLAYAAARLAVVQGDLVAAEAALRDAAEQWRADEPELLVRSALGLTQVLAMQGKLADAEATAANVVVNLEGRADDAPAIRWTLARALRNLATVYVMQERHAAARDTYRRALDELTRYAAMLRESDGTDEAAAARTAELNAEFAHVALNLASAHTFLDAPVEAEVALRDAEARFDQAGDVINRGRARTNLGRLHLRRGDYAAALAAFDQAHADLIGNEDPALQNDLTRLRQADELLLEHALAYVALNLLPEAERALGRAAALFRQTDQPYELAQTRYTQGMLLLRQGNHADAQRAFDEALDLYGRLDNSLWRNRTLTAQAHLAVAASDPRQAGVILDALLGDTTPTTANGAVAWDRIGLIDAWLLRLQLALDNGDLGVAQSSAAEVETILGAPADATGVATLPMPTHIMRLLHARGRIVAAQGDAVQARRYFAAAVDLLDRQRASLPLEEVRTAYLDDKTAYYADLVLSMLDTPAPSDDVVADAFAVVERARARALLERLMASVALDEPTAGGTPQEADFAAQREALRRQLNWLYNRLLGDEGSRHLEGVLGEEVAAHEAALQRYEWQSAPNLAHARPVRLDELQQVLAGDQQAIVYFVAGDEVMAFVVDNQTSQVWRSLASYADVQRAQIELRFQLGRAELGPDYVQRNAARLLGGVQRALGALYQLLVAPLASLLHAPRQLLVPFGALHLLPFHALWDGERYWLERVEVSYVPSASVAVHLQRAAAAQSPGRFAGFAPYDARIPHAQAEIDAVAACFATADTFHGDAASLAQLAESAAQVDVLHLATHGLFRPDNSFFSALKLADGWLDVRAIYRMHLRANLVVLSACESGMGQVRGGDEVVGLVRGFLAAGALRMVATLWNVNDFSAAGLMQDFYKHLQRQPAAALRTAQLKAVDQEQHPYFWAPFFAVG